MIYLEHYKHVNGQWLKWIILQRWFKNSLLMFLCLFPLRKLVTVGIYCNRQADQNCCALRGTILQDFFYSHLSSLEGMTFKCL